MQVIPVIPKLPLFSTFFYSRKMISAAKAKFRVCMTREPTHIEASTATPMVVMTQLSICRSPARSSASVGGKEKLVVNSYEGFAK